VAKLIWGIPLRIFHWGLVILLGISFYTGYFGEFDSIDTHMLAGYGVLTLLIFRLSFGFIAGGYARFSNFIKGPKATIAYVKAPLETPGHNPLGGLAVLAMLGVLGIQVGTGLFATDDIFVDGPLNHLVSSDTAGLLTQIHEVNQRVLLALITLHLLAIAIHEWRLGHRLLLPMITGKKKLKGDTEVGQHQISLALACLGLGLAVTYILVNKI
tara:strand:+ start:183 stop:821 length:639 start_codon:yes stop_codon:yes gene_type:complete